ncbi:FtsB/FtsL family cell division protein [Desulfosarcina ovata]|uniref:hypothetical protein n=1 Tax=Desulfosarcina ovata TaxID=83564 RepID=UPI0012D3033A|nr:hypothetical protein [Desulfosarcina ovata]
MKGSNLLPDIPEKDISPTVKDLLAFIDQQNALILQQDEEIQQLKDEIARLKNQPPRPKIKPSSFPLILLSSDFCDRPNLLVAVHLLP